MHEALKDGVALCRLLNCIKPDTVSSINTANLASAPFLQLVRLYSILERLDAHVVLTVPLS
jgi:hypothetical protein